MSESTLAPLRLRTGFAAVTASSMVLGVAEVSTPVLWRLVPVGVCARLRPSAGVLVAAWTGLLVAGSIVAPFVPGHLADPTSFWLLSCALLTIIGAVWWRDNQLGWDRRHTCEGQSSPGDATEAAQGYQELRVGSALAALSAGTGATQVGAHVSAPGMLRVLVGELQGELPSVELTREAVMGAFRQAGRQRRLDLRDVAHTVEAALAAVREHGYLSAVLIEVSQDGPVRLFGCGGPPPVLVSPDGVARELPTGGLPLGCARLARAVETRVPGPGLLAVVSDAVPRALLFTPPAGDQTLGGAVAALLHEHGGGVEPGVAAAVLAYLSADGQESPPAAAFALAVPPVSGAEDEELIYHP